MSLTLRTFAKLISIPQFPHLYNEELTCFEDYMSQIKAFRREPTI